MPVVEICFIVGVCLCVADSGCLGRGRSDTKFCMDVGLWGIPVVGYLLSYIFMRRKDKSVSLYIDKVLNELWQFMGIVCLAVALMAAYFHAFEVILPLCAILLSLGSIFTGVLIRYTRFSGLSSMGVLLGLRMLFEVWDKSSFCRYCRSLFWWSYSQ